MSDIHDIAIIMISIDDRHYLVSMMYIFYVPNPWYILFVSRVHDRQYVFMSGIYDTEYFRSGIHDAQYFWLVYQWYTIFMYGIDDTQYLLVSLV